MTGDRDLRRAFEDLRELEEQAPPFGKVWLAARERHEARPPGHRLLRTAVALSAAALLVVVLVSAPGLREPAPPLEAEELAQALSEWEAPLDFLLDSPESEMFSPEIWPADPTPAELEISIEEIL